MSHAPWFLPVCGAIFLATVSVAGAAPEVAPAPHRDSAPPEIPAVVVPPSSDEDEGTQDDETTDVSDVEASNEASVVPSAPQAPAPAHYTMDDLAATMHTLAPAPDPSHHTMDEIAAGGL